ncbi:MAG: type IV toxin-antitoxin system AbiEi family antitoxin domain-containing protein [Acidimicrobiia bacterium]
MNSPRDRRVGLIAACQHGVVTRRQALAVGMTDPMIRRRITSGVWQRIEPGSYRLSGHADTLRSLLCAATAALPGVVSHESAAELHGLPHVPRGRAVVTVPARSTYRFPGVRVHQSTDLTSDFVLTIERLPTTSLPRTIVDLAGVLRAGRLEQIIDHCLVTRAVDLGVLTETLSVVARRGKPGVQRLREILATRGPGLEVPESVLELKLLKLLLAAQLPDPVQQFSIPWHDARPGRVDLAYPEALLLIEADGRRWHTRSEAFEADRRRDNLAVLAGWRVLRFTWRDIAERPGEVVAIVREALAESLGPAVR